MAFYVPPARDATYLAAARGVTARLPTNVCATSHPNDVAWARVGMLPSTRQAFPEVTASTVRRTQVGQAFIATVKDTKGREEKVLLVDNGAGVSAVLTAGLSSAVADQAIAEQTEARNQVAGPSSTSQAGNVQQDDSAFIQGVDQWGLLRLGGVPETTIALLQNGGSEPVPVYTPSSAPTPGDYAGMGQPSSGNYDPYFLPSHTPPPPAYLPSHTPAPPPPDPIYGELGGSLGF